MNHANQIFFKFICSGVEDGMDVSNPDQITSKLPFLILPLRKRTFNTPV